MIKLVTKPIFLGFFVVLTIGCGTSPQHYEIAFIEQCPGPSHLRFLSIEGEFSDPVFLPNSMKVEFYGGNDLCWSPDGQLLAFASRASADLNRDIYTINANGTDLRQITQDPATDVCPSWSPDGSKIAFLSTRDNLYQRDIYLHDLLTGVETRLTSTSGFYLSPVWSPTNEKIAFIKNINFAAGDELFILDLASGVINQISDLPGMMIVQGLQWSPSEDRLLFYCPGTWGDVYTIKTDGSELRNLTGDTGNENSQDPSWFIDGQVLYTKYLSSASTGIYRMNINGTSKTMIGAVSCTPFSPVYRFTSVDLPDLVVSEYSTSIVADDPSSRKYIVDFRIANMGYAESGSALVYIDAICPNPPEGVNEIRIQSHVTLDPIQPGEQSDLLHVEFDLAEIHAKEVQVMRINVDAKQYVNEAFETNNEKTWPWP